MGDVNISEQCSSETGCTEHKDSRPVVLITGFGPFANFNPNPAWLTVEALEKYFDLPTSKIRFVFRMIPVEYDSVSGTMPKWCEELEPCLTIHVGTGSADGYVHVETQAYNRGYCAKDVSDRVPANNCCCSCGPNILSTDLDVLKIVNSVNTNLQKFEKKVPSKSSRDPGRYLCGFIYYHSLKNYSRRCLFIHVPPINDYSITAKKLALTLRYVILAALQQLNLLDETYE